MSRHHRGHGRAKTEQWQIRGLRRWRCHHLPVLIGALVSSVVYEMSRHRRLTGTAWAEGREQEELGCKSVSVRQSPAPSMLPGPPERPYIITRTLPRPGNSPLEDSIRSFGVQTHPSGRTNPHPNHGHT